MSFRREESLPLWIIIRIWQVRIWYHHLLTGFSSYFWFYLSISNFFRAEKLYKFSGCILCKNWWSDFKLLYLWNKVLVCASNWREPALHVKVFWSNKNLWRFFFSLIYSSFFQSALCQCVKSSRIKPIILRHSAYCYIGLKLVTSQSL